MKLYNTLTRTKDPFTPIDPANVRMYVCGPTVYDHAHIGNARPIIVFDVLFRLLRHLHGPDHVTYVRNITDVDDKINARAAQEGRPIDQVTAETTEQFHRDIAALGVLEPTVEPRATGHIAEMKAMIETLVDKGHAYVADGHVLFDVTSAPDYGALAKRTLKDMIAGARVDVAPYKKGEMDFVLWKPSKDGEPGWPGPCGIEANGRPGWHIECSAMAKAHLGEVFDIHGGGIDLTFPHHENELAQSRCAHGTSEMARVWMHNGYLQVEGEKMSKSAGNFITINELLETDSFGGQKWHGRVLRLAMLMTHYRQPIDWTADRLFEARANLVAWNELCHEAPEAKDIPSEVVDPLSDDLNTPSVIAGLHKLVRSFDDRLSGQDYVAAAGRLRTALEFLGLYEPEPTAALLRQSVGDGPANADVRPLIDARIEARKAKDFAEADRIRDELTAMGVQLMDGKDPETGELVTEWEIKQ